MPFHKRLSLSKKPRSSVRILRLISNDLNASLCERAVNTSSALKKTTALSKKGLIAFAELEHMYEYYENTLASAIKTHRLKNRPFQNKISLTFLTPLKLKLKRIDTSSYTEKSADVGLIAQVSISSASRNCKISI